MDTNTKEYREFIKRFINGTHCRSFEVLEDGDMYCHEFGISKDKMKDICKKCKYREC